MPSARKGSAAEAAARRFSAASIQPAAAGRFHLHFYQFLRANHLTEVPPYKQLIIEHEQILLQQEQEKLAAKARYDGSYTEVEPAAEEGEEAINTESHPPSHSVSGYHTPAVTKVQPRPALHAAALTGNTKAGAPATASTGSLKSESSAQLHHQHCLKFVGVKMSEALRLEGGGVAVWYFTSAKDGTIRRKHRDHCTLPYLVEQWQKKVKKHAASQPPAAPSAVPALNLNHVKPAKDAAPEQNQHSTSTQTNRPTPYIAMWYSDVGQRHPQYLTLDGVTQLLAKASISATAAKSPPPAKGRPIKAASAQQPAMSGWLVKCLHQLTEDDLLTSGDSISNETAGDMPATPQATKYRLTESYVTATINLSQSAAMTMHHRPPVHIHTHESKSTFTASSNSSSSTTSLQQHTELVSSQHSSEQSASTLARIERNIKQVHAHCNTLLQALPPLEANTITMVKKLQVLYRTSSSNNQIKVYMLGATVFDVGSISTLQHANASSVDKASTVVRSSTPNTVNVLPLMSRQQCFNCPSLLTTNSQCRTIPFITLLSCKVAMRFSLQSPQQTPADLWYRLGQQYFQNITEEQYRHELQEGFKSFNGQAINSLQKKTLPQLSTVSKQHQQQQQQQQSERPTSRRQRTVTDEKYMINICTRCAKQLAIVQSNTALIRAVEQSKEQYMQEHADLHAANYQTHSTMHQAVTQAASAAGGPTAIDWLSAGLSSNRDVHFKNAVVKNQLHSEQSTSSGKKSRAFAGSEQSKKAGALPSSWDQRQTELQQRQQQRLARQARRDAEGKVELERQRQSEFGPSDKNDVWLHNRSKATEDDVDDLPIDLQAYQHQLRINDELSLPYQDLSLPPIQAMYQHFEDENGAAAVDDDISAPETRIVYPMFEPATDDLPTNDGRIRPAYNFNTPAARPWDFTLDKKKSTFDDYWKDSQKRVYKNHHQSQVVSETSAMQPQEAGRTTKLLSEGRYALPYVKSQFKHDQQLIQQAHAHGITNSHRLTAKIRQSGKSPRASYRAGGGNHSRGMSYYNEDSARQSYLPAGADQYADHELDDQYDTQRRTLFDDDQQQQAYEEWLRQQDAEYHYMQQQQTFVDGSEMPEEKTE